MSKIDQAKKELNKLGFYTKDDKHEDDFVIASQQISGGVIFEEYSDRFKSFKALTTFLSKQLNIEGQKLGTKEFSFPLSNSKVFSSIEVYQEKEKTKIFFSKKL
jgi:hypothetical protein